ncbi:hypothetical protein LEP1GSC120_4003 [Leptospira santarosai str. 200702252]|nr:hypothetical protein LEP1GSC130_3241 [Leptospira santarosai str. 200403458]EMO97164.1 hypothetical protein LEP1GSC120_4003 [Leptospira santarosai str. 200702252]
MFFVFFFDGESNEENESASEVRSTFLDFVVFLLSEESAFFLEEESADDREEDEVFLVLILFEDALVADFLAEAFFRLSPSFKQGFSL